MSTVDVPEHMAAAVADVLAVASDPECRSRAAGDELGVSFDSDDRDAMLNVAALFLARVAYLDIRETMT